MRAEAKAAREKAQKELAKTKAKEKELAKLRKKEAELEASIGGVVKK